MKRNKYNATKVFLDGHKFDSKKEARRYGQLKLLKQAGEIKDFEIQPKYEFRMNDKLICSYYGDFKVTLNDGTEVVEDVKSEATRKNPVYRIKNKMMKAFYNIDIKEI